MTVKALTCPRSQFIDKRTGTCKSANHVYGYEAIHQTIDDDIAVDNIVIKYSKRQIIDELEEFKMGGVARELVNMVSRKKIDDLSEANKRVLVWADYWLNKYALRGLR